MSAPYIGQRRSYDGALCTVRYIGDVAGTSGSWLGVEWDDPSRGKHDGQHKGVRYFSCKSKSPTAASFVRPTRPADAPQSFLAALHKKYVSDPDKDKEPPRQVYFNSKVAEEVGFDKVRRKQAKLDELKYVILDGLRVARAYEEGAEERPIGEVCPEIRELDLSRNLFERFGPVVEICRELKHLKSLRINGNRFQNVQEDEKLHESDGAFNGVTELALEDTLLDWQEICHIAAKYPALTTLHAGLNQFSTLTSIPEVPFTSTLVSIHLEFNEFSSLFDLAPLTSIASLRNLLLKGNKIDTIAPPFSSPPVFSQTLQHLDISYNRVSSWSFVDALNTVFPGLTSLRFTHNPIYDDPDLDTQESYPSTASSTTAKGKGIAKSDEAFMLTIARLASLKTLNFSPITANDRSDAEMFYLSRIARQLSSVPEAAEKEVLARHRRWAELCEVYGEPAVVRQTELNPNFLEARLIKAELIPAWEGSPEKKCVQIPKAFDIYAVKGIVGRLFGLPPLGLKLVWETGEWDPAAGFEEDEAGEGEEDLEAEWERKVDEGVVVGEGLEGKKGRWVKREVELKDGPRQFGYCVDGLEVRIRVEKR